MKARQQAPRPEKSGDAFLERFLPGSSPAVRQLRERVRQLNAPRNAALVNGILILGESGVGKNHLAQVLAGHRRWLRVQHSKYENPGLDAPLAAFAFTEYEEVHLPALPDALIESELFGYKRGAFTDAKDDRRGLLGGLGKTEGPDLKDILLDEIGDASPALQTKLLQLVEKGKFRPVGSTEYFETGARMMMATNRDLGALVRAGKFREDLYWRLSQFVVVVPPLRDQPENIESIARSIEREIADQLPAVALGPDDKVHEARLSLSAADIAWARRYSWPGNVREMGHAITRWFLEEGKSPLCELVIPERGHYQATSGDAASVVADLVRQRLEMALLKNEPVGSLIELVKEIEREVKYAANAWYRDTSPTDETLQRLFPGKKAVSLRNKLNTWRRR
jgi:transcriptional regulator with GAF, ATPase, and Fis domain